MEASEDKTQRSVQSVEVGGRLLLALAGSLSPMSLKDLAARAQLPASRAHPYLVSYARLGLVQQEEASGRYALGPAALQLGLTALHQCDPVRVAEPIAAALAAKTGQAVALAVWGNFGATVIRMIDARQPLHVSMRAGTIMALFSTATGRAFVGAMRRERVLAATQASALGDPAPTGSTTPSELDAHMASAQQELAQHGCTRAVGRPIPGVNAFSAPIIDHDREPVLVMTLLGHQDHVPAGWGSPMAAALKRAAGEVSRGLGARPLVECETYQNPNTI